MARVDRRCGRKSKITVAVEVNVPATNQRRGRVRRPGQRQILQQRNRPARVQEEKTRGRVTGLVVMEEEAAVGVGDNEARLDGPLRPLQQRTTLTLLPPLHDDKRR